MGSLEKTPLAVKILENWLYMIFSDLYPQFVLKLDDHFEEDFTSFAEDTGLEDIGIDSKMFLSATSFPAQSQVKNLFAQLNQEELDDLVYKYRVDLDMYQYSPKQFYSYVTSKEIWEKGKMQSYNNLTSRSNFVKTNIFGECCNQ